MKNVRIYSEPMIPSKGLIPRVMVDQYHFRQTGEWEGGNEVGIALLEEPIWWNRPIKSDVFLKQESDGMYSLNFPYFGGDNDFKAQYNTLLNVGCVPVAIQLNQKDFEKPFDRRALVTMPVAIVYDTLVELGVDPKNLESVHNDLLYCGKKFMGVETVFKNGYCSINFIVTLFYKPEESIFKRLTGKYALARPITGIIEETNLFTREQFTEALMKNMGDYLKDL
jgi:hypothetical protein